MLRQMMLNNEIRILSEIVFLLTQLNFPSSQHFDFDIWRNLNTIFKHFLLKIHT